MTETDTARHRLARYCTGVGLDLGACGGPIVPHAICIDLAWGSNARTSLNSYPTHLVCGFDAFPWFRSEAFDFVYSSHQLPNLKNLHAILLEWLRIIRPGGYLVLFLPDEQAYVQHCLANKTVPNPGHRYPDFSLEFLKAIFEKLGYSETDIVHELFPVYTNPYSFDLVIRKKPSDSQ